MCIRDRLVTVAEDGTVRDYTYRCGPMNEDLVVAVASYAYHELNLSLIHIFVGNGPIHPVHAAWMAISG